MFPESTVTTAILIARVYKRESVLPTKRYSPLGWGGKDFLTVAPVPQDIQQTKAIR